ncbi:acetyl-CoA carboxylase biotin carboxyl carrier protein [Psychrobacter sp. AOP22-C1-C5]|uniref:acetyl-CoA carboxylase biotin carboxyl carrier protein n=1 Tax=Psychrobacter sp. AOP22-C1-C5 TaxID=3457716 RepID=UPI004035BBB5
MNINFTDLEKLIKLAEGSDIKSLEITDGDTRISIVCQVNDNHNANSSTRNSTNKVSTSEQQTASVSAQKASTNDDETIGSNTTDETVATEGAGNHVTAPMLGTFYLRPDPTAETFFKVDDQIEAGQTLCIIEAMKMMYEVKAETSGTLKEILVEEGDVVEYEQPLFVIAPNS